MKKHNKIILLLASFTSILSIPMVAMSCEKPKDGQKNPSERDNEDNTTDPTNPTDGSGNNQTGGTGTNQTPQVDFYSYDEIKQKTQGKSFDQLFELKSIGFIPDLKSQNSQDIVENWDSWVQITPKDPKIGFTVVSYNVDPQNKAKINVYVAYKWDQKDTTEREELEGQFQIGDFKIKENNTLENPNSRPSLSEEAQYFKLSAVDRYNQDFEKLRRSLEGQQYSRPSTVTAQFKEDFNKKAKELNLPDYDTMNALGWTIPTDGSNTQKLNIINKATQTLNSWVDYYKKDQYKNIGLARTLTNQTYSDIALQTFQTNFSAWIYTSVENLQIKIAKLLKNTEDLKLLAGKIKNEAKKQEYIKKFSEDHSHGVVEKYRLEVYDIIKSEQEGDSDSIKDHKASEIYTEYIKDQREKLKKHVEANYTSEDIPVDIKNKMIAQIEKAENFTELANSARSNKGNSGTSFIVDYQIQDNKSYPTKWYFATNYHVIDGFNDKVDGNFSLRRLSKDYPSLWSKLRTTTFETKMENFSFPAKAIKRVIDGRDFFTWDPSQLSLNTTEDKKEFVDFAVYEVDFEKLTAEQRKNMSAEDYAKLVTNDYFNLPDDKKLKIANFDYLSQHDKIDIPITKAQLDAKGKDYDWYDQLYSVSYPASNSKYFDDFWLDKYVDKPDYDGKKYSFSLWTNADYTHYGKGVPTDPKNIKVAERGGRLSNSVILRTFKDKNGVYDRFLNAPIVGELYTSNDDGKKYYQSGLAYLYAGYSPGGGASGSSVRTKDQKLVSLISTAYNSQSLSSGLSVRSNGLDLKGLFGTYNIPQYDIFYGGGKDQKSSFKQELNKLYPNAKTYLFPNGLSATYAEHDFNSIHTRQDLTSKNSTTENTSNK